MRPLVCVAMLLLGGCVWREPGCGAPPGDVYGNLNRVCDVPAWHPPPLRAEGGDVWAVTRVHVPTMLEVQTQRGPAANVDEAARAAPRRPRDNNLCRAAGRSVASLARGLCYADRP